MQQDSEFATIVVLESSRCLMADSMDIDSALTVLALVSEDPSSWDEALSVWPRYRTSAVCEFPSGLPIDARQHSTAIQALNNADAWVAIDFQTKRVFTGGGFPAISRDAVFAFVDDECGKPYFHLTIHLPPWWELHEHATAELVNQRRLSPLIKPVVNRDILYGYPFLSDVAVRILETVHSHAWQHSAARDNPDERHPFTVAVHRDWLMTPRDDLFGRSPRNLLHGAIEWSERVTDGQRRRFEDGGPMIALPNNWDGYASAPLGRQEMCVYFDLCRAVINAGWDWCVSGDRRLATKPAETALSQLRQYLRDVRDVWLSSPCEGSSPPSFIIECDRRRVPRGSGVAIEGVDGVEFQPHIEDCDCPICNMMAMGSFGVVFDCIDGHHLELDNEFAFSMHETRDAWEEQQRDFAEFNLKMDCELAELATAHSDDPFASPWSGIHVAGSIPGDCGDYLKLAFMVAEIVSDLQRLNAEHADIRVLNSSFAEYWGSGGSSQCALKLKETLELLANRYRDLVPKSADLQSRIEEAMRADSSEDGDVEIP